MNPLLDDAQREHITTARRAVEEILAPVADVIDDDGACPAEILDALTSSEMLGGTGDDRLLRLALTVEQVGRKSAAVAALVATRGVGALVPGAAGVRLAVVAHDIDGRAADDGFVLDGAAPLVIGAAGATTLMVIVEHGDAAGIWNVPAAGVGVQIDEVEEMLGLNGSGAAAVRLAAVKVAATARLGDAAAAAAARAWLTTALAAVAVGVARGALDAAVSDVVTRRDAGERVDKSQPVQWMLADIATETEAARVATWFAATQTPGAALAEAAAMCRVLAAEAAVGATRRAVQVLGDRGVLRSAGVERLYRDAKVLEILGGSNEAHLARIAAFRLPDLAKA